MRIPIAVGGQIASRKRGEPDSVTDAHTLASFDGADLTGRIGVLEDEFAGATSPPLP